MHVSLGQGRPEERRAGVQGQSSLEPQSFPIRQFGVAGLNSRAWPWGITEIGAWNLHLCLIQRQSRGANPYKASAAVFSCNLVAEISVRDRSLMASAGNSLWVVMGLGTTYT